MCIIHFAKCKECGKIEHIGYDNRQVPNYLLKHDRAYFITDNYKLIEDVCCRSNKCVRYLFYSQEPIDEDHYKQRKFLTSESGSCLGEDCTLDTCNVKYEPHFCIVCNPPLRKAVKP